MEELSRLRWRVLLVLLIVATVSALVSYFVFGEGWGSLLQNFGTEMLGAVVTYGLLELVVGKREELEREKDAIEELKAELISKMGSRVREIALHAVEELKRYGWLWDGSLDRPDLVEADLHGVDLQGANLQGAILGGANLVHTNLNRANLEYANFGTANLSDAGLQAANLRGATLNYANLQGADLLGAILEDAILEGVNFENARLLSANLARADFEDARLHNACLAEANLEGAKVEDDQLAQARSLGDATMPDGRKYEEWKAEGRLNSEAEDDESGAGSAS